MPEEAPAFQSVAEAYAVLGERVARDPHRPRYHFLPPAGWMNDPNGTVFHAGQYHMFFQHGPYRGSWPVVQHWGHATSQDLVHWTHLPIALTPDPAGPDHEGCWSGSAVMDGETAHLLYTGVMPEVQCLATSTDGLLTWEKYVGNPVIGAPPEGLEVTGFRDPHVWREADDWRMVIGSGIYGQGGAPLLYRSADLQEWEYLGPLCVGDKAETGEMWECPDFFPLGGRQVLVVFTLGAMWYAVGDWDGQQFTPEQWRKLDWGPRFFAARSLLDGQGRRVIWGWVHEMRPVEAYEAAGWAGALSLPRVLTLTAAGEVVAEPAPELAALRGERVGVENLDLPEGQLVPLPGIGSTGLRACAPDADTGLEACATLGGDCLEIRVAVDLGAAREVTLHLRRSPGGEEETLVRYDRAAGTLTVDLEKSSLDPAVEKGAYAGPLALGAGERLELRVFLDRSVIEVFAGGRLWLTARMYPTREASRGVALQASGGAATASAEAWEMTSVM